jgi:hypothetical protein
VYIDVNTDRLLLSAPHQARSDNVRYAIRAPPRLPNGRSCLQTLLSKLEPTVIQDLKKLVLDFALADPGPLLSDPPSFTSEDRRALEVEELLRFRKLEDLAFVADEFRWENFGTRSYLSKPASARCQRHGFHLLFSDSAKEDCAMCLDIDRNEMLPLFPTYDFSRNLATFRDVIKKDVGRLRELDKKWKVPKFDMVALTRGI